MSVNNAGTVGAATRVAARLAALRADLTTISRDFSPVTFASSFGAEDMLLLDVIAKEFPAITVFTLDTGRLPQETLDLLTRAKQHYGIAVERFSPEDPGVNEYVATHGLNGFYDSVEARKACCHVRKVLPLAHALAGRRAWLTGLRREQAASRATLAASEFDRAHGIEKFNPLIDWSLEEVWHYLRTNDVPYNALHDRGYPSIGCEPCTRAVKPGEDIRAGRWWWENSAGQQECGLHVEHTASSASPAYTSIPIRVTEKVNP
jgi:phosphoadenosine phosphosulfate reductase